MDKTTRVTLAVALVTALAAAIFWGGAVEGRLNAIEARLVLLVERVREL